ncbi:formate dehydrogenase subunit gamma [Halovulum dunhuangense]|uniref:Formate dehydrogenase subunit gamma n=1 Tax=Halovulum dunhuangense TaxID=1505036 RepID=A0A849L282_9RHOB|nr:formate dehydrogenase subunit gamma [Halovulum dunhuangense]NNU80385.1 formate dehydrogenase subunit gamma [Halovulum dunhuangense]
MTRFLMIAAMLLTLGLGAAPMAAAQDAPEAEPRAATGGASTLEDILARQRGEQVDDAYRRLDTGDPDSAAGTVDQLGTLGFASDSEVYRALRYGTADVTVSTSAAAAGVLIQDRGMWWLQFRQGPLLTWGGYGLLGVIGLLAVFYLLRGRIRIDGPVTGEKILRFNSVERFAHWLLAGSFILLGITGLVSLFGRIGLIPLLGKDSYAVLAGASKWVHNNVSWAFMLALVMIFLFWVIENIPNRHDLKWLAKGGGLFSKGVHPPAKKFNAGQKLIFWAVIVLGGSISVSGLSLLFPFELPMFAFTFEKLNAIGVPGWLGMAPFPTELAPHEEMQFAQLWHAIISFVLMAIIIAHIYLGSVGMEGAFDAMGSGEVEKQWAREHHGLWVAELEEKTARKARATPAE